MGVAVQQTESGGAAELIRADLASCRAGIRTPKVVTRRSRGAGAGARPGAHSPGRNHPSNRADRRSGRRRPIVPLHHERNAHAFRCGCVGGRRERCPTGSDWPRLGVVFLLTALLFLSGCGQTDTRPLKGVIVEVFRDPPALLVDHEEIPGFMPAMRMRFEVDAATAAAARPGQAITARLRYHEGVWRLEAVHHADSPKVPGTPATPKPSTQPETHSTDP
jgi:hypothetical protein